jgi:hypothetical protein
MILQNGVNAQSQKPKRNTAVQDTKDTLATSEEKEAIPTGNADFLKHVLNRHFEDHAEIPSSHSVLTFRSFGFYQLKKYELSRLQCAFRGADMGANYGLFLGALGSTAGLWDEKSSFFIMGAMSLLGAIFGGTIGADDPGWSVRVEWEPVYPERWFEDP